VGFTLSLPQQGDVRWENHFRRLHNRQKLVIGYYGVERVPVKLNSSPNYPQNNDKKSGGLALLWISDQELPH
jgi:hypothetical protein